MEAQTSKCPVCGTNGVQSGTIYVPGEPMRVIFFCPVSARVLLSPKCPNQSEWEESFALDFKEQFQNLWFNCVRELNSRVTELERKLEAREDNELERFEKLHARIHREQDQMERNG